MTSVLGKHDINIVRLGSDADEGSPNKKPTLSSVKDTSSKSSVTTDSSSDKSPISTTVPTISKLDAIRITSTFSPPSLLKKKSRYQRFKSAMLKDAKEHKDEVTIKKITSVAKNAWKVHYHYYKEGEDKDDDKYDVESKPYLLSLENRVIEEERKEISVYQTELKHFRSNFTSASAALLYWNTIECTIVDTKPLEEAIKLVETKLKGIDNLPTNCIDGLSQACDKLTSVKAEISINLLVSKLRNATDEDLVQHAREHQDALKHKSQLEVLNAAKAEKERIELAKASSFKKDIISSLYKDMTYTDSSLKDNWRKMTFTKHAVTQEMFDKAFEKEDKFKSGSKKIMLDGDEVGTKSLRYGGCMCCANVEVTLKDDIMTATTSYGIIRRRF